MGTIPDLTLRNLKGKTILIDYDGGTNPIYVGFAEAGVNSADEKWRIMKLTWDGNDNPTSVKWASGNESAVYIWDSRAGYSYS